MTLARLKDVELEWAQEYVVKHRDFEKNLPAIEFLEFALIFSDLQTGKYHTDATYPLYA